MTSTVVPPTIATERRVPVMLKVGAVLGALLAFADLFGTIAYWSVAPLAIDIVYIVVSAAGFLGAWFAWRGAGWGVWVLVVTRVLSLILSVPVFLAPEAPAEAVAPSAVQDVVTVVAIVLLLVGLARGRRA